MDDNKKEERMHHADSKRHESTPTNHATHEVHDDDTPKEELSPELLQKFIDLVEHGKIVGTVTDEEIFAIVKPDTDAYDELMKRLDEADIDIVAGEELGELKATELDKKDELHRVSDDIEDFIEALDDEEDFANYASALDADENADNIEDAIKSKDIDQTLDNDLSMTFSDDPIMMYLREIGQVDRLTAVEEVTLSQKVQDGLRAREELKRTEDHNLVLSNARRRELNDLADDGMDARNQFIEANLRLVVFIAKRYQGRGMQFQDLIQEGNLGLIKAVNKYDATKGFKFATYATWWIKQSITRAIADQARTIRIPVHMVETINKLVRTQRRLTQELHREPTTEELADEMGITVEKVQMIQKIAQEPVSLEKPVGEEEDSTLGDFVSDQDSMNPLEYTENAKFKEAVDYLLKTLTPREEQVLRLRFGLVDGKQHTLEEVGREFHVTRERIRQIEAKAIRRLRHPTRQKIINQYR